MQAYVARPEGTLRGGFLVFHEAFGLNAHIRDVANRFAAEGYLAIAPDLFHRTAPGFECDYTEFRTALPHIRALTDPGTEADISAAYAPLRKWVPEGLPVSAIGYCMGGRTACLAALTLPLAAAVSYYGGGIGPHSRFDHLLDRLPDLQAPMLLFWGGRDSYISFESTRAVEDKLRGAEKTFTNVDFSYADHGFFCDARATYNAEAATQSWALTKAFLAAY
jgi:carboxymethylenebutenolidase